jgi:Ni,Fe-hydrogenase I large subunit
LTRVGRITVGPFNRVEGDLEVHLDIDDGRVREAWVNAPLFRGFEQILTGKDPRDALIITARVCGICSVAQSMAAARALADAQGVEMPANGRLAVNLVLATENVADHLTHFYMFFMPDFARGVYADEPWHGAVAARFAAMRGAAASELLEARAEFMHLMGLLAGKWPHTLSIQPGGSTRPVERGERLRLLSALAGFRRFLETRLFGDTLERIAFIDSQKALDIWADEQPPSQSDLRTFLDVARRLELDRLGRAGDRFMSYGAYDAEGASLFRHGVWEAGSVRSLDLASVTEDVSHGWYQAGAGPHHPSLGSTLPDADRAGAYSWCKAPRLGGRVVEVGALARQLVDGHPLVVDLVAQSGGNVRNRVIARLLEIARVTLAMERWLRALRPDEPFCSQAPIPEQGQGVGLVEAARGSLGHWVSIKDSRIANYQIVAPTTWNFSPRDAGDVPGALEQALVGAPVREDEKTPVSVQHIVRSFDPCMVCTVH